nr:choice-of-anchor U domain-containing protein [Comamonas koreensis]
MLKPLLAAAMFLSASMAHAQSEPLVQRDLSERNGRFIDLSPSQSEPLYVVNAMGGSIRFDAGGVRIEQAAANQAGKLKSIGVHAGLSYAFDGGVSSAPLGQKISKSTFSSLVGSQDGWVQNRASYSELVYRNVWSGVDAVFKGTETGLKYQFELASGANPKLVGLRIAGAQTARVTEDGALEWNVNGTVLRDGAPIAWQTSGNKRVKVPAKYLLQQLDGSTWRVTFELGAYDTAQPLVIDPAWAAPAGLVGGNSNDTVNAVARDTINKVTWTCGTTQVNTVQKAFVARFKSDGTSSSFQLGGNGNDSCRGLALDQDGNAYIGGTTESTDFPTVGTRTDNNLHGSKAQGDKDAFFAKINATDNTILWSSLFGGAGDDQANAVATDASGRLYITGFTTPTCAAGVCTPNAVGTSTTRWSSTGKNAFIARVAEDGQAFEYFRTLNGDGSVNIGHAISVDPLTNAVVVAGETNSTAAGMPTGVPGLNNVPNARPANDDANGDVADGFVARVNSTGDAYEFFTLLTGAPDATAVTSDRAMGVQLLEDGSVLVVGETNANGFPVNALASNALAGGMDGFVVRLTATGTSVLSARYLGGTGYDSATAVTAVGDGYYVIGNSTGSLTNAVGGSSPGGLSTTALGGQDGFLARFAATSNALDFWGLIGASGTDSFNALAAEAVDFNATTRPFGRPVLYAGGASSPSTGNVQRGELRQIDSYGPPATFEIQDDSGVQNAVILQAYADLKVLVKDTKGQPVPRVIVKFVAPNGTNDPSTSMPGTSEATADVDGYATLTGVRANGYAGAYIVKATSGVATANFSLTNLKADQTSFTASASNASVPYQTSVTLTPTGGVPGVTVTYKLDPADTNAQTYCSLSGDQVSALRANGSCKVIATNPGNSNYNPASWTVDLMTTKAPQPSFAVAAAPASIPVGELSSLSFAGALSAGAETAAVGTSSSTVCAMSGTAQVKALSAGSCVIEAVEAGDDNYFPAIASTIITVTKGSVGTLAVQATPATIAFGQTSQLSVAPTSSTGSISYAVTSGPCAVQGNTLSTSGAGTCLVTATQAADENYEAGSGETTINVNKADQMAFRLTASDTTRRPGQTASLGFVGGTTNATVAFSIVTGEPGICTLSGNTISAVSVGACTVQAVMPGDANYLDTPPSTITINIANQAQAPITVSAPLTSLAPGDATAVTATGGSGTINYTYHLVSGGSFCALNPANGAVTAIAVGTCVINASNPPSLGYDPATSTNSVTIKVVNRPQEQITISAASTSIALKGTTQVTASGGSGTISYTYALVSGADACTLDSSSGLVTGKAIGTCEINASNAASAGYDAATSSNSVTISVGKASQTIAFSLPAGPLVLRAADVTLSATTDAEGLTVSTFASKTARVCEVEGATLKFYTAGTCTVTASQSGDATYAAAEKDASVTVTLPAGTSNRVIGTLAQGSVTAEIAGDGWTFGPQGNVPGWEVTGFFDVTNPAPPANLRFPAGLFGFTAINGPKGTAATITITYPMSFPSNAQYWKYGKTADNAADHWYQLPGVVISGNTVSFSVIDGGLGDSDLLANSVITDPGGVAINTAAPEPGAVTPVPSLSTLALTLLSLLIMALMVVRERKGLLRYRRG